MAEGFSNGQDYTDLPPLDNRLVASAAATLDAAKIPHLLWGNYMLTIFGIPTIVDGFDFVIDDISMDTAYDTLQDAGFNTASLRTVSATETSAMLQPAIHICTSPHPLK